MKQSFGRFAIAALSAGVLCLIAEAALAKNPSRPFKGRSEGMITASELCPGGELFSEEGNATHLGLYTATGCTFVVGAQSPTVLLIAGGGMVTAANGDQINIAFTGTIDIGGDPWVGEVVVSVAGGTGRFADASGQFDYVQLRQAGGPAYTATATGTIAY
jgi:hypothetical protein